MLGSPILVIYGIQLSLLIDSFPFTNSLKSTIISGMTTNCTESNITYPVYLEEPFGLTIFRIGFQVILGIFGIIGNAVVCLTIIRKPHVLGPTSQYLLSLAIADLCVLLFNFPIAILKEQDPFKWFLGEAVCLYLAPATETFFTAAIFSITLVSLERYVNVARKTNRVHRMRSRNRKSLILVVAWVASFVLTSVPLYMFQAYDSCRKACYLTWSPSLFSIYMISTNVLLYVLPLAIIIFSSLTIARLVSKRTRLILKEELSSCSTCVGREVHPQSSSLKTMLRQKRKTYRILKPLVILFAVTMFPFTAFRLVLIVWTDLPLKNYYTILITLVMISTVVNSAADPLVYCVVNEEFRQEVKRILPDNILRKMNAVLGKRKTNESSTGTSRQQTLPVKNTCV